MVKANIGVPGVKNQGYQIGKILEVLERPQPYQVQGSQTNKF